ncbi:hypothetical protein BDY24DRAFT_64306 [Mrakia frigida]|uniref:uncharacterized protein n=1 Tax=Mrakia frigida TaxID=29902 RepID=UPI003FCBFABD
MVAILTNMGPQGMNMIKDWHQGNLSGEQMVQLKQLLAAHQSRQPKSTVEPDGQPELLSRAELVWILSTSLAGSATATSRHRQDGERTAWEGHHQLDLQGQESRAEFDERSGPRRTSRQSQDGHGRVDASASSSRSRSSVSEPSFGPEREPPQHPLLSQPLLQPTQHAPEPVRQQRSPSQLQQLSQPPSSSESRNFVQRSRRRRSAEDELLQEALGDVPEEGNHDSVVADGRGEADRPVRFVCEGGVGRRKRERQGSQSLARRRCSSRFGFVLWTRRNPSFDSRHRQPGRRHLRNVPALVRGRLEERRYRIETRQPVSSAWSTTAAAAPASAAAVPATAASPGRNQHGPRKNLPDGSGSARLPHPATRSLTATRDLHGSEERQPRQQQRIVATSPAWIRWRRSAERSDVCLG